MVCHMIHYTSMQLRNSIRCQVPPWWATNVASAAACKASVEGSPTCSAMAFTNATTSGERVKQCTAATHVCQSVHTCAKHASTTPLATQISYTSRHTKQQPSDLVHMHRNKLPCAELCQLLCRLQIVTCAAQVTSKCRDEPEGALLN